MPSLGGTYQYSYISFTKRYSSLLCVRNGVLMLQLTLEQLQLCKDVIHVMQQRASTAGILRFVELMHEHEDATFNIVLYLPFGPALHIPGRIIDDTANTV